MRRRPPVTATLLALLLVAMAAGQAADRSGFAAILRTYDVLGGAEPAAAALVPALELATAAALLASPRLPATLARAAGLLGIGVALFWSLLAAQAFARGLAIPNCGCFGVYLGQSLRWWVLLQDAYFLALAWFAARSVGLRLPARGLWIARGRTHAASLPPPPGQSVVQTQPE